MPSQAHLRIDEGLKRGPRQKDPARTKRLTRATLSNAYPESVRAAVVESAIQCLAQGLTTNEIGLKHDIPGSTVRFWLLNDERAEQARQAMIDQELILRGEQIDVAADALALGRAREGFRYWAFISERRDSARYGQRQEVTHVNADLGNRLRRARERVIDAETVASAPQIESKED